MSGFCICHNYKNRSFLQKTQIPLASDYDIFITDNYEAGTYYLLIEGLVNSSLAPYSVTVTADLETDDFGNSCDSAKPFSETTINGELSTYQDHDYIQFTINETTQFIANSVADFNISAILRNSECIGIGVVDNFGFGHGSF